MNHSQTRIERRYARFRDAILDFLGADGQEQRTSAERAIEEMLAHAHVKGRGARQFAHAALAGHSIPRNLAAHLELLIDTLTDGVEHVGRLRRVRVGVATAQMADLREKAWLMGSQRARMHARAAQASHEGRRNEAGLRRDMADQPPPTTPCTGEPS